MIELNNFSFSYKTQLIFDNINFKFEKNNLYIIHADNGIGKSTLFKIFIGILKNYTGTATILDHNLNTVSTKVISELISICLSTQPTNSLKVAELFEFSKIDIHSNIEEIRSWDIEKWLTKSIETLSEGERQWVFIARAFLSKNPIILLDEPTAFLDKSKRNLLIKKIEHSIENDPKSILINTHDDHLSQLKNAQIVEIKNYNLELFN